MVIFGTIPQHSAQIDQSRPKFSLCQKVRRLEKSMLLSVEAVATIYQLWRAAVGQSYVVIPFVCATKHCIICNYDYQDYAGFEDEVAGYDDDYAARPNMVPMVRGGRRLCGRCL